jgi:hypothetical protein
MPESNDVFLDEIKYLYNNSLNKTSGCRGPDCELNGGA